mmetsp:Transcript_13599/g.13339  ORF Transcript_13599/g.13339 Transcript_13599/m.13339 type:complete len:130 (+) Transcript_13599:852-1241(+)
MINSAPISAARVFRRIIRHQCYEYIYQRKLYQKDFFEHYHLEDEDLFLDLKLNFKNDQMQKISELFNKEMVVKEKKGKEFEEMPFFLSDNYKQIITDYKETKLLADYGTQNSIGTTLGGMGGGSSLYKS